MTAPLKSMLKAVFSGLLNEKLVEDTAQKVRDDETRAGASRDMQRMQVWQIPTGSKMLEGHERKEVKVTTSMPVPCEIPANLFQAIAGGSAEEKVDLASITKDKSWWTFNSESLRDMVPDEVLLVEVMKSGDGWGSFDYVWQNGLVPPPPPSRGDLRHGHEQVLVHPRGPRVPVLCWPLVGRPGRQFTFDLQAKTLWWVVCMREEQWRVIPTRVCSPLRLKAEAHLANGLWMQMDGQPMTLREFVASRAFAHVPEKGAGSLAPTIAGP